MRRLLAFNGSLSGGRKWAAWVIALAAVGSMALVATSAGDTQQGAGAKAAVSADVNSARAMAVANARSLSVKRTTSTGTRQGASDTKRPGLLSHDRSADNSHSAALFAAHSWYVAPPPPPPAPPPPPVAPSAPPFPYTFVGAYTSEGDGTVYFLAQGDRVIDAHVGDHLDGVYQFESATAGQLTFNYMPLNIRQLLSTGAPQ